MDYRTKFVKSITDQLADTYPNADNISSVGAYIELIIPEKLWENDNFARDFNIVVENMGLLIVHDESCFRKTLSNGITQKYYLIKIGILNEAGD